MDNSLIKRQAVIDKINERQRKLIYCFGFENDMVKIMDIAKSIVIAIPSAQPEQKWISCSETIDIPDHEVMACDRYGEFIIGYLDCKDEQWLCESDDSIMYDPVAWCELPKPYKEGGVDG